MKYIVSVLFSISFFSLTFSTSFAVVTKCPGEPLLLSWTSSSCPAAPTLGITGGPSCGPVSGGTNSGTNVPAGAAPFTVGVNQCQATIGCGSPTVTAMDTVDVVACSCGALPAGGQTWGNDTALTYAISSVAPGYSYSYSGTNTGAKCIYQCDATHTWNGSSCVLSTCANGANNYPTCTTCTLPLVWNAVSSSCVTPTGSWSPAACPSACGYAGAWQTCTGGNGLCSGSASFCPATAACTCNLPWGGTIPDGGNVTAYQSSSVAAPASCISQVRVCGSGTLSGTYTNQTCLVTSGTLTASALSCTIASQASSCPLASVSLTWSTTNPVGTSQITSNRPAANTTIFTNNGLANQNVTVSGAYPSTSYYLYNNGNQLQGPVTVTPSCIGGTSWDGVKCALDCALPWGGSITSGSAVTAYSASTINNPGTCASISESRTCTNGTLSGSFTNQTCTVTFITGALTVPASCTIASGASTCTVSATWSTMNTTAPALVDRNVGTTLSTLANQGAPGLTVWVSHPSTIFDLKDGALLLDTMTVSGNCIAGTTWDGAKCLQNVVIGTFTLTTPTISSGGSTMLNWTGVTGGGVISCSIDNGIGAITVPPAAGNISTGVRAVDTAFTLTCTNGANTATKSVTLNVISGSLNMSAPSCQIAVGASSCTVTATWATAHTTSPKLVDMNMGATLSTLANRAAPFTVWIGYDHTTFNLNDGAIVLASTTVFGTLPPGGVWASPPGVVVVSPTVSLVPANSSISYGATTTLTWTSSDSPQTTECHNATPNWTLNANTVAQLTPATGNVVTSPLSSALETFTIACTGPASPVIPITANAVVSVCSAALPVWNGAACQPKPIAALTLPTGNYTPVASLQLACTNASSYTLKKNGSPVAGQTNIAIGSPYNGSYALGVGKEGDYILDCNYTSADGHTFTASSIKIVYYSAPTNPVVSLKATPASVSKGSAAVLSWSTMFPGDVQTPKRSCKLVAYPVCVGACSADQITASTTVNGLLQGNTDASDPDGGNRAIQGIAGALNVVAHPGPNEWRALGRKTINLDKSMDFHLDCGVGAYASSTVRVNVVSSNEG